MTRNLVLFTSIILLLSSCYSSRKAKIDNTIKSTVERQEKELAQIKSIEENKADKLGQGKIDDAIDKKITSRLTENRERIDSGKKIMDEIAASSGDRKTLKKSYRKLIKSKLAYLKFDDLLFIRRTVNYGLITDALDNSKQTQFDLATFFGTGEYLIPQEKAEQAKKAFEPLVDSILLFAHKYLGIHKNSTIVLKGYADATGIKYQSPLYYRLVNELKQNTATNAELNLALSKLRTESINAIVNQILQKKQLDFTQQRIVNVELIQEGRGEEKPNPKIADYKDDDDRRRIVLFFWSLLPA